MQSITSLTSEQCRGLQLLFCDIDDTLTHEGKLLNSSYQALWRAKEAGLRVVPITGRPAGWVDHIARMWPVDAVIGENGGLYFWMQNGKLHRHYLQPQEERIANRQRLDQLAKRILQEVPGSAIASDQPYREFDLAIDYCEDVTALSDSDVARIVALFREVNAEVKVSSIHVNGWFGSFNKLTTCRLAAQALWNLEGKTLQEQALFCGDSPNDEPMFSWFPFSVGVANIQRFFNALEYPPKYVTPSEGGHGFAELVDHILRQRNGN